MADVKHSCQPTYKGRTLTIECDCGWSITEVNAEPHWSLAHGAAAEHLERMARQRMERQGSLGTQMADVKLEKGMRVVVTLASRTMSGVVARQPRQCSTTVQVRLDGRDSKHPRSYAQRCVSPEPGA